MKKIAIFGSTGSIGKNAIKVIAESGGQFQIELLTAKSNIKNFATQINQVKPKYAVIADEDKLDELKNLITYKQCNITAGRQALEDIAKEKFDLVICAIMGFAGLKPTFNAIQAGSDIAIANKEPLVCAGEILNDEAKKSGSRIIPIDSEHNAIFQIFEQNNLENIKKIILTASGGPFFNKKCDFSKITVDQALKHPNWSMGAKISIDSATMMNKGLEMIEAFHLFDIKKEQIDILIHPQSIIHGIVDYNDGSSLAMLSQPDMKTPISYALSHPKRMKIKHKNLNLSEISRLDFFQPDESKFRALKLCKESLKKEGNAPILLNAANEVAVERFLKKEIKFNQISEIVEAVLNKVEHKNIKNLAEIINFDMIGRQEARKDYKH